MGLFTCALVVGMSIVFMCLALHLRKSRRD